jgi:hypothetical protein
MGMMLVIHRYLSINTNIVTQKYILNCVYSTEIDREICYAYKTGNGFITNLLRLSSQKRLCFHSFPLFSRTYLSLVMYRKKFVGNTTHHSSEMVSWPPKY